MSGFWCRFPPLPPPLALVSVSINYETQNNIRSQSSDKWHTDVILYDSTFLTKNKKKILILLFKGIVSRDFWLQSQIPFIPNNSQVSSFTIFRQVHEYILNRVLFVKVLCKYQKKVNLHLLYLESLGFLATILSSLQSSVHSSRSSQLR